MFYAEQGGRHNDGNQDIYINRSVCAKQKSLPLGCKFRQNCDGIPDDYRNSNNFDCKVFPFHPRLLRYNTEILGTKLMQYDSAMSQHKALCDKILCYIIGTYSNYCWHFVLLLVTMFWDGNQKS